MVDRKCTEVLPSPFQVGPGTRLHTQGVGGMLGNKAIHTGFSSCFRSMLVAITAIVKLQKCLGIWKHINWTEHITAGTLCQKSRAIAQWHYSVVTFLSLPCCWCSALVLFNSPHTPVYVLSTAYLNVCLVLSAYYSWKSTFTHTVLLYPTTKRTRLFTQNSQCTTKCALHYITK